MHPLEKPQAEGALFSIDPNSGGPMAEGKLGTPTEEGIELRESLVHFAARQAEIAALAQGKSASTGDD
jgi:hypothetical protein